MDLFIRTDGQVELIYDASVDLASLGEVAIRRASQVEPDKACQWHADLGLSHGPVLGPFDNRNQALSAEIAWLTNRLTLNQLEKKR